MYQSLFAWFYFSMPLLNFSGVQSSIQVHLRNQRCCMKLKNVDLQKKKHVSLLFC